MSVEPTITVKGDIEHIQLRPGMYIGNTFNPDHLCQEILDNSIDELINGHANTVWVDFIDNNRVVIQDDGRGIPIHNIKLENGDIKDSIIVACTMLKSGSKFDNAAYQFSIGLHGIGLVAVNALSTWMRVSVKNKQTGKINDYIFESGVLKEINVFDTVVDFSTRVEFIVNPKYFTQPYFNSAHLIDGLKLVNAKFPNANFIINQQKLPNMNMDDLVREFLEIPQECPIYPIKYKDSQINIEAYLTYDLNGVITDVINGDVNLRRCKGTYLTNLTTLLANTANDVYSHLNITKSDIMSYLRLHASIFIQNPEFDSQSKISMTKNISHLLIPLMDQIKSVYKTQYIKQCIEAIIEAKNLKKAGKKTKRLKRVESENPLQDCKKSPGRVLYIMEGRSADGTLGDIRDSYDEAILPLSGKILNVVDKSADKATNSKKFKYLLQALGVDLSKKQQSFRYEFVKILCDADADGLHIAVLVLIGIWLYAPQLIIEGRVSIILPPLCGVHINGTFIPLYPKDITALNKYKDHPTFKRYKGIGEMNPEELEVILKRKIEYVPKPPTTKDENDSIIRCISDTELKRTLCLKPDVFSLNRLMERVNI